MKNLKKRNLVLILLVLFALAISGTTYAYWASSVSDFEETVNNEINIGTGEAITISVDISDSEVFTDKLVPTTVTPGTGETNSITVTYTVTWNDDALLEGTADVAVSALVSNIQVGGVANPYSLVSVTPVLSPTTIGLGATVTFTFDVTMSEPANVTEYDAVANQAITFDITFNVN